MDRGGRNSSITRPSKYPHFSRHFAGVAKNSALSMGEEIEKVMQPFDQTGENNPGAVPATDGALSSGDAPAAQAAVERGATASA
jgi:hypothetical protein